MRAYAHDLKTFFSVVDKEPVDVRAGDVMAFIKDQRQGRSGMANVVRMSDASAGLSSATIRRRLAAVSAFYGYLVARDDVGVDTNPVPRGLATRRRRDLVDEALPLGDVRDVVTEDDGHGALVVRIEAGDRLPYLADGQAWGRSGPKNVTLTSNGGTLANARKGR